MHGARGIHAEVMSTFDLIRLIVGIVVPLTVFFLSAFLWLMKRMDRKAAEDKATFQDLYRTQNLIRERLSFLEGKRSDG